LLGACLCIFLIHANASNRLRGKIFDRLARIAPFGLQFVFGALFSAFLIFYIRSSAFIASWPFLLFLALLFAGNEFLKKQYVRLTFQLSIFFIALFSYLVFALPVVVGQIGTIVFLASGFFALIIIAIIISFFLRALPEIATRSIHVLLLSIAGIYALFQIFYFTNIIPPIPLSLKESGVYHSLERVYDGENIYKVTFEEPVWYAKFQDTNSKFHWQEGERVYFYSAIFAPTKISLPVYHRWLYFDENAGDWVEKSRVNFSISGGRDGGYRGYSYKTNISPGKWRVEVMTKGERVLGRGDFEVIESKISPDLVESYL
jgi:hypothetical protein